MWVDFIVEFKGLSCKRQNETVTQDDCDSRTITTLQQETSSNSTGTKKKIKLEKDKYEREKAEQTRNLDRGKVDINYKYIQQQIHKLFFLKYYVKVFVKSFV